MISFLTLGTSEKKNRAPMPATAPNPPAVYALPRQTISPGVPPISRRCLGAVVSDVDLCAILKSIGRDGRGVEGNTYSLIAIRAFMPW